MIAKQFISSPNSKERINDVPMIVPRVNRVATALVAFFAIVSLSSASRCRHINDCYDCIELDGCGWCESESLCLSGSRWAPLPEENQTCPDAWAGTARGCCRLEMVLREYERKQCDRQDSCNMCAWVGNGCVWCMPRDGGPGSCVSGGPGGPTNATCGRWINETSECYYVNGIPYGKIQLIVMLGFLSGAVFARIIFCAEPYLLTNSFRGLLEIIDGISLILCVKILCTIQIGGVLVGVLWEFFFFVWNFIVRRFETGCCFSTSDLVNFFLMFFLTLGVYAGLAIDDVAHRGDSVFALACFSVFSGYILETVGFLAKRWNKVTVVSSVREVGGTEDVQDA